MAPRFTPFERFLQLFTKVRPGEGRPVALFGLHIFLILFASYLFKSLREGLILDDRGDEVIASYGTATIAALLMALVPIYSQLRRLIDGALLINAVIGFFVGSLTMLWLLARAGYDVGFVFFVWVGVYGVMMVAQFWALAADSFNLKAGQRLFPVVMLGAQVGALAGAEVGELLALPLGAIDLLLIGLAALVINMLFTVTMHASVPDESRHVALEREHKVRRLFGGFDVVASSRYLTLIAIMIVLINWISSTGDYIHRSIVNAHFEAAAALDLTLDKTTAVVAYFGNFYFWMVATGILLQALVVPRLFRHVGVSRTLLIAPVVSIIGWTVVGFAPLLTLIRFARMFEMTADYSLTNTSRQALFLPTDKAETYEGKTTIETFFWRFGDLLQAGMVYAGTRWLEMGLAEFAVFNVVLASFWIAVAMLIGRMYRELAHLNLTNAAPRLTGEIPHAEFKPGVPFVHQLPPDLFEDSDPGDVLTLSARCADGSPLPDWLRFDARHHRFHCDVHHGGFEELLIEVVATDNDGESISGTFVIRRVSAG